MCIKYENLQSLAPFNFFEYIREYGYLWAFFILKTQCQIVLQFKVKSGNMFNWDTVSKRLFIF